MLGIEEKLRGRRIPREKIPVLPERNLSFDDQAKFAAVLLDDALAEKEITIDPMAFLDSLPGGHRLDRKAVREKIIRKVRTEEGRLAAKRSSAVIGAHALRLSSMRRSYAPSKFGRKMWCFGSTKEIRLQCINWFKEQLSRIADLRERLCRSDFLISLPPGFFAPGGYLRANLVPWGLPF